MLLLSMLLLSLSPTLPRCQFELERPSQGYKNKTCVSTNPVNIYAGQHGALATRGPTQVIIQLQIREYRVYTHTHTHTHEHTYLRKCVGADDY